MGVVLGTISVEMPAHEVVHTTDDYEVWRYPSSVAAIVKAADLDDSSPSSGGTNVSNYNFCGQIQSTFFVALFHEHSATASNH